MKTVLFALLLLLVALAILPVFLPNTMHVEEEYTFDSPIEKVYNHFNDLQKFEQFDAWTKKDSTMVVEFSTPTYGEEASYQWTSENARVRHGSMTITATKINEFVNYDLNFDETEGNTSEVIFQRLEDNKTRVVWSFDSGEVNYPYQIFVWVMKLKGTVKDNLRKSLENLEVILQKPAQLKYGNLDVDKGGFQIVEQDSKKLFGVLQRTSTDETELNTAIAETLGLVRSYLIDANGMTEEQIGKPVVFWKQKDKETNAALFYCGFIFDKPIPEKEDFEYADIPSGKFLTTFHNGDHRTLDVTYMRLRKFAEVQGLELSIDTYDVYYNDVSTTDEKDLKTQIFIPILN